MTQASNSPRTQLVIDTIVYFLTIAFYAALLHWIGAPGWATFGFALAIAKIDAVGSSAARTRKRLGA